MGTVIATGFKKIMPTTDQAQENSSDNVHYQLFKKQKSCSVEQLFKRANEVF